MSQTGLAIRFRRALSNGPAWTVADQAMSSAVNFLTFVLLARAMAPDQLGVYALAFTGLFVAGNIQRALFVEPHYVYGPRSSDYPAYTSATAVGQVLFAITIGIVAVVAVPSAEVVGVAGASGILLAFAAAAVPYLVQDFMRGLFFTESRYQAVFVNDMFSYGGQLAFVVALVAAGEASPVRAVLAVGLSSGLAVLVGIWQFRDSTVWPVPFRRTSGINWKLGRWLGLERVATTAADELYVFLSSGIVNVAAAGAFRAIITVLNVNNIFMTALIGRTLPRASEHMRDHGSAGLNGFLVTLVTRQALPIYAYSLVIIVAAEPVLGLLYGEPYRQYSDVLQLMALVAIMGVPSEVLKIGMKAREIVAPLLTVAVVSALVTICAGIPLLMAYGLIGAAIASCIEVVAVTIVITAIYSRASRRARDGGGAAPEQTADASGVDDAVEPK